MIKTKNVDFHPAFEHWGTFRLIYCVACHREVKARLTDGFEIYPAREDLWGLPFWKCDDCGNHVGCHHKSNQPTKPLGCIATPELYAMRSEIHAVIDPLWKTKKISRGALYHAMGKVLGRPYHTGELQSMEEAEMMLSFAKSFSKQFYEKH